MNIEDFLLENVDKGETQKEVKLERFKSPFVIRAISEQENSNLKKASTIKVKNKNGVNMPEFDSNRYNDQLLAYCVVTPDLKDSRLQESYSTQGSATDTLKAMLRPGEFTELSQAVLQINGYLDEDENVDKLKEEVKN